MKTGRCFFANQLYSGRLREQDLKIEFPMVEMFRGNWNGSFVPENWNLGSVFSEMETMDNKIDHQQKLTTRGFEKGIAKRAI